MTVEVPPTETVTATVPETATTAVKDINKATEEPSTVTTAVIEKTDEPTLTTQIEPPSTETAEEAQPTSATEEKPKRKGLFNNPFANKVKKESEEAVTTLNDTAEATENKITKGFGNFLSKVKVRISKGDK